MNVKKMSILVTITALLLLAAGVAQAFPNRTLESASPASVTTAVSEGINYQGFLRDAGGAPLNGTYTMRFVVYDAAVAGSSLWDSGNISVAVADGLFNVQLGVDQADFDGQALWLSIIVDSQTLSPRQEILAAPYALSLRPGADIVGDSIGASDAVVAGYAPATGIALYADANGGTGVFGDSENSHGVWGTSNDGWGGYFTSENGYGIRVDTNGNNHYDHGAYITSNFGYAVYAQSVRNQGVRGEAGDLTGISSPLGPIGVVGMGQNRGVVGASDSGTGIYANSSTNYGVWGQSNTYRGITGRTDRIDSNYGFYTPDNLFSSNYNFTGSIMQVMQNTGSESLAVGDVVVFSGIDTMVTAVDAPIVQVSKANAANSTAVAGVVFSRFNIDSIDPDLEFPDGDTASLTAAMEVTPAGDVAPGEYVLVVIQGPAQVKVNSLSSDIQPGDLLSSNDATGTAGKAAMVSLSGVDIAIPGTVFGKALESFDGKQSLLYVYVTLQ